MSSINPNLNTPERIQMVLDALGASNERDIPKTIKIIKCMISKGKPPTYNVELLQYDCEYQTLDYYIRDLLNIVLNEAKNIRQSIPCTLIENITLEKAQEIKSELLNLGENGTGATGEILDYEYPECKNRYRVVLTGWTINRIKAILGVKRVTGLGLGETKDIVEDIPRGIVFEEITPEEDLDEKLRILEEFGCTIELEVLP